MDATITAFPAAESQESDPTAAAKGDTPKASRPTGLHTLHGLAVMIVGFFLAAVGLMTGEMASAQGNVDHAGTGAGLLLAGLGWTALWLRVRNGERWALRWVALTGAWVLALALYRHDAFQGFLVSAKLTHPVMVDSVWAAAALSLLVAFGCVVRGWVTGEAASTQPGLVWTLLGAMWWVALLLVPTWLLPAHAGKSAQGAAAAFRKEAALGTEPRIVFGAAAAPTPAQLHVRAWTVPGPAEARFQSYLAELEALRASGAQAVVLQAVCKESAAGDREEEDRYVRAYVVQARELGLKIVASDGPSPYLTSQEKTWEEFASNHRQRVRRYMEAWKPDAYVVAHAVLSYYRLGNIQGRYNHKRAPEIWQAHLETLAKEVKRIRPETLAVVCIQPWIPEETEIYRRLLTMDSIDVVAVEAYDRAQLEALEHLIKARGHPESRGKRLWILESYRGRPTIPGRDESADADWLSGLAGWAQAFGADAVFARPLGAFVPGGHLRAFGDGSLAERWREAAGRPSAAGARWRELSESIGRDWSAPRPEFYSKAFPPARILEIEDPEAGKRKRVDPERLPPPPPVPTP